MMLEHFVSVFTPNTKKVESIGFVKSKLFDAQSSENLAKYTHMFNSLHNLQVQLKAMFYDVSYKISRKFVV